MRFLLLRMQIRMNAGLTPGFPYAGLGGPA
jgi:hypothetical protein